MASSLSLARQGRALFATVLLLFIASSALAQGNSTSAIAGRVVAGDGSLRYGDIVDVIDAAKGAGVEKVGIVTEGMRRAAANVGRAPGTN